MLHTPQNLHARSAEGSIYSGLGAGFSMSLSYYHSKTSKLYIYIKKYVNMENKNTKTLYIETIIKGLRSDKKIYYLFSHVIFNPGISQYSLEKIYSGAGVYISILEKKGLIFKRQKTINGRKVKQIYPSQRVLKMVFMTNYMWYLKRIYPEADKKGIAELLNNIFYKCDILKIDKDLFNEHINFMQMILWPKIIEPKDGKERPIYKAIVTVNNLFDAMIECADKINSGLYSGPVNNGALNFFAKFFEIPHQESIEAILSKREVTIIEAKKMVSFIRNELEGKIPENKRYMLPLVIMSLLPLRFPPLGNRAIMSFMPGEHDNNTPEGHYGFDKIYKDLLPFIESLLSSYKAEYDQIKDKFIRKKLQEYQPQAEIIELFLKKKLETFHEFIKKANSGDYNKAYEELQRFEDDGLLLDEIKSKGR